MKTQFQLLDFAVVCLFVFVSLRTPLYWPETQGTRDWLTSIRQMRRIKEFFQMFGKCYASVKLKRMQSVLFSGG